MRKCKDCQRWLPADAYSSGSNWMQCKKCKAHQVLLRAHERRGDYDTALRFEADGRFRWFQDYKKFIAQAQAVLNADVTAARQQESQRARLDADYCASQKDRWDSLPLNDHLEPFTSRDVAAEDAKYSAAQREARRMDPERERAKERAKRAKNPDLYKALNQKSSAQRRTKRANTQTVPLDIVWLEHDGRCNICGEKCDSAWWHLDHIVPLAAGGEHSVRNCAPAHPYCNLHKGARTNDMIDVDWLRVTRPVWEASDAAKRMREHKSAPCGTVQRYWKGCRCDACRKARRSHAQERRGRAKSRSGTKPTL